MFYGHSRSSCSHAIYFSLVTNFGKKVGCSYLLKAVAFQKFLISQSLGRLVYSFVIFFRRLLTEQVWDLLCICHVIELVVLQSLYKLSGFLEAQFTRLAQSSLLADDRIKQNLVGNLNLLLFIAYDMHDIENQRLYIYMEEIRYFTYLNYNFINKTEAKQKSSKNIDHYFQCSC